MSNQKEEIRKKIKSFYWHSSQDKISRSYCTRRSGSGWQMGRKTWEWDRLKQLAPTSSSTKNETTPRALFVSISNTNMIHNSHPHHQWHHRKYECFANTNEVQIHSHVCLHPLSSLVLSHRNDFVKLHHVPRIAPNQQTPPFCRSLPILS